MRRLRLDCGVKMRQMRRLWRKNASKSSFVALRRQGGTFAALHCGVCGVKRSRLRRKVRQPHFPYHPLTPSDLCESSNHLCF